MATLRNPFKHPDRRRIFDTMIRCADNPSSEFYHKGQRRTGASHRCAFWAGAENVETGRMRPVWVGPDGTMSYTCYRAGQEWAKARRAKT
jgi:hypothetical protein